VQEADGDVGSVDALFKIVGGAAVVGPGTVIGTGLMLAGRGVFTRSFAPDEYGLFSLAFTVTSILTVGAMLGLRNGIPRQIAYHGSKDSDSSLVPGSIVT